MQRRLKPFWWVKVVCIYVLDLIRPRGEEDGWCVGVCAVVPGKAVKPPFQRWSHFWGASQLCHLLYADICNNTNNLLKHGRLVQTPGNLIWGFVFFATCVFFGWRRHRLRPGRTRPAAQPHHANPRACNHRTYGGSSSCTNPSQPDQPHTTQNSWPQGPGPPRGGGSPQPTRRMRYSQKRSSPAKLQWGPRV